MVSVITAIYNQLPMNKLFWEYLSKYTDNEFELIIIDNNSTDGSREFFQSLGDNVKVIANSANYSYPHCQNQGIEVAKYDTLAFLNNDLLVSPHWDSRMMKYLGKDNRHVLSCSSNDRLIDKKLSKSIQHRWKWIKYPLISIFGQKLFSLKLMRWLCYGNWEKYCQKIYAKYDGTFTEGFSGSFIVMNRKAVEILGCWDKQQQGADFNLFFETKDRAEKVGDMQPLANVNGVFIHHYRRLTLYSQNLPKFVDEDNLIGIGERWKDAKQRDRYFNVINFNN